jgi:hypothetical protein
MATLLVEIVTPELDEGTTYQHKVDTEADTIEAALKANYAIIDAIFTLYGKEEIISYTVSVLQEE